MLIRTLGRQPYAPTVDAMRAFTEARTDGTPDELWLVEHDPVYTQGLAGKAEHVLNAGEIPVVPTNRGGQITYHGPGQVVGYPIVEIPEGRRDVHRYVRELEEVMIRVCADYGFAARRIAGKSGTFVGDNKIGAIGVRISRWVTSHGFAFNVNTNLSGFDLIVPCGLRDQGVTSLAKLLGAEVDQTEVEDRLISRFLEIMDYPARRGRDQTPVASR